MNRTLVALVLTVALVAVPYGAWMISTSTNLTRENQHGQESIMREARDETAHLAADLSLYLQQLRQLESGRPYDHYLHRFQEDVKADEKEVIDPPVLAHGASNPIIMVYFQITDDGHVAIPSPDSDQFHRMIQSAAKPVVAYLKSNRPEIQKSSKRTVTVPRARWAQIIDANKKYLHLDQQDVADSKGDIALTIEPFIWQTLALADGPALVALRCLATPQGKWVQGFAISPQRALQWVSGRRRSKLSLTITAGHPSPNAIAAPFMGETWWLSADITEPLLAVDQRTDKARRTFILEFSASALAAVIAGTAIICLVWQSERLARQRSRFAASAAHELRTPLAGLRMYGEMLSEGLGDPENMRAYAQRISDEAHRLGRVVNNVLGFARIERGSLAIRFETGDLGATVRGCVERHRLELEKSGITLDVQIEDNLPHIRFDNDAVGQIMQNLLDNAEKYSRAAEDRTIHVRMMQVSRGVAVSVRDHGPGIDPRVRRHLFEPFTRAKHRNAPAGIGLGLMITHALVRAHRGRIEVENAEPPLPAGAIFTVTFRA